MLLSNSSSRLNNEASRVEFLDTYRFFVVTFALISHGLIIFDGDADEWMRLVKFLTRSATPGLVLLFGVILEIVYYPKYSQDKSAVAKRLLYRSSLCYIVFILLSTLALVLGQKGLISYLAGFFLLTPTIFSNIFLLYLFWLILSIPLLYLRHKFGFSGLFVCLGVIWLIDFVLIDNLFTLAIPFNFIGGVLIGIGDDWGPSVFHGLSLVIFGMTIGDMFFSKRRFSNSLSKIVFVVVLASSFIATICAVFDAGLNKYIDNIVNIKVYRASNNILYYMYGVVINSILLILSYFLNNWIGGIIRNYVDFIGRNTFSYFVIGNFILILLLFLNIEKHVVMIIPFLVLTLILTIFWENKLYYTQFNQSQIKFLKTLIQRLW